MNNNTEANKRDPLNNYNNITLFAFNLSCFSDLGKRKNR